MLVGDREAGISGTPRYLGVLDIPVMSTHVLHLKAAESFLETSHCTLRTLLHGSAEKSRLQDVNSRLYSKLVKIWVEKSG